MKAHVLILFLSALFLACTGGDQPSNADHSAHNASAKTNSSAGTATVDHTAMGHGDGANHSGMRSSPGAASAAYDLQFIDTMIVHHKGAVDMAMLAEARALHKELKDLAADIIDSQEREMARMSELRDRWFDGKAQAVNMAMPGMSHGMGGMNLKRLESLKGNEFDVEFIRQMIPHHEGAVEMAKDLANRTQRTELKELVGTIIADQQKEIEEMTKWSDKWKNE